jgi:hypothetical protein
VPDEYPDVGEVDGHSKPDDRQKGRYGEGESGAKGTPELTPVNCFDVATMTHARYDGGCNTEDDEGDTDWQRETGTTGW